eukprot:m.1150824 g.1150824  ORF g.1150824 m.1150824 type:complete len:70 (+) comp24478_c1_seq7:3867-4076(+)
MLTSALVELLGGGVVVTQKSTPSVALLTHVMSSSPTCTDPSDGRFHTNPYPLVLMYLQCHHTTIRHPRQ